MKRRSFFSRSKSNKRPTTTWKSGFVARAELLEARQMLAGDMMQNVSNIYDVNNDSFVSPADAATLVLEMIQSTRVQSDVAGEPNPNPSFLDVTGDGQLNQDDLDAVVERINGGSAEPGDGLTFRFETVDLNGNAITAIDAGDQFELVVFAQDTSADAAGVFAAYLDVEFAASLATADEIKYSSAFPDGRSGTLTGGVVDEAGAFTTTVPSSGSTEQELFRVLMTADSAGQLTFTSNAADELPTHEVLLFGTTDDIPSDDILYPTTTLQINGDQQGDDDLVGFAKALAASNVQLWSSTLNATGAAAEQLNLFGDGEQYLPINEVFDFVPSASDAARFPLTSAATAASISSPNIWIWPDGSMSDGSVLSLAEISNLSNVPIPKSVDPSIAPIDDVTVLEGAPLHIPLDGYDPNGDPLTYTVTVGDSSLVSTFIPQNNRSLRIPVQQGSEDLGEIILELFEGRASRATDQFITLAEDGFFDDIIFHRVIDQFMIQGGDPTGTGTGGSPLPDFDDQFHVDLQHTSSGLLSMAKSADDTNNSQFFLTEVPTRWLDFNHTVFGQMVEGERVRQTISNVEVGARDKPVVDVVMNNVTVFEDNENAVLMLSGLADSGSTTVTVTATDLSGNSTSETFNVDLAADTSNGTPFLKDIEDQVFETNETVEFQVEGVDAENDTILYSVALIDGDGVDDTIAISDQGVVTASGWVGVRQARITVGVGQTSDNQVISISVLPSAPTSVDLVASADSGLSDSDNLTNVTDLEFEVTGVSAGTTVIVLSGDTEVGRGQATGDTVTITQANTSALGSGQQDITAVIETDGLRSLASPALSIVLDQVSPVDITNDPSSNAAVGMLYSFDAAHPDEGSGDLRYSLSNAPTGMEIDPTTGQLTWTPASDQRGSQTYGIVAADLAGNETTKSVTVSVSGLSAGVSIGIRDSAGNAATGTFVTGDPFFVDVFVEDLRESSTGITEAFVDIAFDTQGVAEIDSSANIEVGSAFGDSQQTGTASATGVVNVGGMAATSVVGRTLLATIPMVAQGSGALNIDVSANATGGVTLDGETQPVGAADLQFSGGSVFVLGVSDNLTAVDDTLTIDEDSGEHTIDVLLNDTVTTTSGEVTITSVSNPRGEVEISSDGRTLIYTPELNFPSTPSAQDDTFTYTITDSNDETSTATVTVTVLPVNDPPVAGDFSFPADLDLTTEVGLGKLQLMREGSDAAIVFDLLTIDSIGVDEDFALVTSVSSETSTVEVTPIRASVFYTPGPNVSGEDTFTYTITDRRSPAEEYPDPLSDTGTVTVYIAQVNDAPDAVDDTLDAIGGRELSIDVATLLDNDTAGPLEDDLQTLGIDSFTQPTKGTLTQNTDGSFTYVPNAGASGTDTFTYSVLDDGITEDFSASDMAFISRDDFLGDTATVTIQIVEGNSPPTAIDDQFPVINDGTPVTLPVISNDTDDDTTSLSVTAIDDSGTTGVVSLENGVVSYTPAADFVGSDKFTYTVSDGELTDTAEVTVDVREASEETNSRFSGTVFFDANNNGSQDSGEAGLGGVPIFLSGTDDGGNPISRQAITLSNGSYQFETLPKGTFEISQKQSSVLLDGSESASGFASSTGDDSFSVTVGDSLVVAESNTFAERGLSPKLAMLDALSSRRDETGFLTAVTSEGSDFVRGNGGWEDYSDIQVTVENDQVTINAKDENSNSVVASASVNDKSKISMLGRDGDTWLIRVLAAASSFIFEDDNA